jgi:hypothetical protein
MAKITVLQCDLCDKSTADTDGEGKRIEVDTHRVALDMEAVDLEVCQSCWHDVRHNWVDTVFDVGRKVPRRGPRVKPKDNDEQSALPQPRRGRPRKTAEGLAAVKP